MNSLKGLVNWEICFAKVSNVNFMLLRIGLKLENNLNNRFSKIKAEIRQTWLNLEVCVPECHFPRTGFFPKKSGKFPVPSIREQPFQGRLCPVSWDWLLPGLVLGRETFRNSRTLPERNYYYYQIGADCN